MRSSSGATLLGVDAFGPEASVLSCTGCGRVELLAPSAPQLFRQAG